ncbi:uncharacterized protein LOC105775227 [Gossypium raimondii]|uniref:uncharacterized protein LOC105775227 n=1 Tax=Gossypium raimondii TaxID=29730 RepID=UPI00063ACE0E|nr:uncharacterized protein LOC105775227 [Gossypium raimondii]
MAVVNSIRLLGEQFSEARIVEKVISTLPERYEAKISSLEDSRDLTTISLTELINALYAQEQRRASKQEEHQEGAFLAKTREASSINAHKEDRCWFRPDAVCQHCKKKGHVEKVCKSKGKPRQNKFQQPKAEAQVAEESSDQEEHVFVVSCAANQKKASKGWLLDSGCTNHMSPDATIFKTLDRTCKTKVKIGNGQFINAEEIGDVLICTSAGGKIISNVLLMVNEGLAENFINSVKNDELCEVCQQGKQARLPFPASTAWRASEKLQKSEVAPVFLKFKAAVETESGCKLKALRSDNGTEYTSAQFQAYCEDTDIKHQLTNVYTPQQNGVPAVKRGKLDKRAQAGILIGYSTVEKGYRILKPSTKEILVSRDVVFNEKGCWNWEKDELEAVIEDLALDQVQSDQNTSELDVDDKPVRGTRSLIDVYERAQMAITKPSCFEEAESYQGWKEAMTNEIRMIEKNQTWNLVERPKNRKIIGFSQRYGSDYLETFAPVARLDTIRLLVALVAQKQWMIHQLDVKSAFLNGFLEEEIYVEQPQGFKVNGKEEMVYKLNKALYGLKQAPRAWYSRIDSYLTSLGFERSLSERTLYVKSTNAKTHLIVSLYVDDLLVTGGDQAMLVNFKTKMQQIFKMSDLGLMSFFLGMEVTQGEKGICLSQRTFAMKILNKFSMQNCKATSTPVAVGEKLSSQDKYEKVCETTYRSLVRCLLYLTATRPDIMYAVSLLSRFMHCLNESHFRAAKRVLRYIKGTLSYGMLFAKAENLKLVGYCDSG